MYSLDTITAPQLLRGAVWWKRMDFPLLCHSLLLISLYFDVARGFDSQIWNGLSHFLAAFCFHLCHGWGFFKFKSKLVPDSAQSSAAEVWLVQGERVRGTTVPEAPLTWNSLHPFSHHSQSGSDPSDPALLLQEFSAYWSPPELAQQVLLISRQAGASQHESPSNNPSWSSVHPFSLTWDVFTGTICFPSPHVCSAPWITQMAESVLFPVLLAAGSVSIRFVNSVI